MDGPLASENSRPRPSLPKVFILKVLHVQESLSPRYGGPTTVLSQLVKAQAEAGFEVAVATTNADYPAGTYHEPGWDTLAGGAVKVLYASNQFAPLKVSFGLANYLRQAIPSFDVVHLHGLFRFPTTFAAYICQRYGIPYIIAPHGSLDPWNYERSSAGNIRLKRLYERWFDLPNLNAASAIHYTAAEERDRASSLELISPSFIVPNGLDWELFKSLPARGQLRGRWGVGDAPTVLFVGRIHPMKGLDLLIPAFDFLRREVPNARLVIAGPENDNYGQHLRGWVAELGLDSAIHFVGPLWGPELVQAYVDADVFCLPSYAENFGMTVVEAMASAAPVVISDEVKIHGDISEGQCGLVTRCDVDELSSALMTLLRDADRCKNMGRAGRQLVKARYSWPGIVQALGRQYESVIKRASDGI